MFIKSKWVNSLNNRMILNNLWHLKYFKEVKKIGSIYMEKVTDLVINLCIFNNNKCLYKRLNKLNDVFFYFDIFTVLLRLKIAYDKDRKSSNRRSCFILLNNDNKYLSKMLSKWNDVFNFYIFNIWSKWYLKNKDEEGKCCL